MPNFWAFTPLLSIFFLEMEEKSDCVIVGCREKGPEQEHLSEKDLQQRICAIDKDRAGYYKFYTNQQWANPSNYGLCINTTHRVIKEFVPIIAKLFR